MTFKPILTPAGVDIRDRDSNGQAQTACWAALYAPLGICGDKPPKKEAALLEAAYASSKGPFRHRRDNQIGVEPSNQCICDCGARDCDKLSQASLRIRAELLRHAGFLLWTLIQTLTLQDLCTAVYNRSATGS